MSLHAFATKASPLTLIPISIVVADFLTLGGIIVAAIGVIVAAVVAYFTIRNLQRSYWRNLVDERDAEIAEMRRLEEEKLQERAVFAEEQRELRHKLKNEAAECKKQLELERAKADLSTVFSRIDVIERILIAHEPTFDALRDGIHDQGETLRQILAALSGPT